jgi:3-phosphoshikimate 1-carboxyvinyltransferase
MSASTAVREYQVAPGAQISGEVRVPGDKSISHRSLMLGGIASGETHISGFLASEDCLATLGALSALGVRIERPQPTRVIVYGVGADGLHGAATPLDMGNAGTAMRLSMGLLAGRPFATTLIGDASLMRRPMERVAGPLRQMGAEITTRAGLPPVQLHGGRVLRGINYAMPVASAQVKSAILLAGLSASGSTRVTEPAPTRDHTERMLGAFGVRVDRAGSSVSVAGGQPLIGTTIEVPADFSSAAFFLVAGALAAPQGLVLRNVGVNPTRTGLLTMLQMMGARITVHMHGAGTDGVGEPIADLEVHASPLRGIEVPEALVPLSIDEFPVFFIAAACAKGETVVRGAAELRVKESDRLAVMAAGLKILGVDHTLLPDGIRIRGGQGFSGGTVDSHGDHRIAMSFAIASLKAQAPIHILDVANVATSFPGFVELARSVGLRIVAV